MTIRRRYNAPTETYLHQYNRNGDFEGYSVLDSEEHAFELMGRTYTERPINTFGNSDRRSNGTRTYQQDLPHYQGQREYHLLADSANPPPKNILGAPVREPEQLEMTTCFTCGEAMVVHPTRVDCPTCYEIFIETQKIGADWWT